MSRFSWKEKKQRLKRVFLKYFAMLDGENSSFNGFLNISSKKS
jgi:hypothetical protein